MLWYYSCGVSFLDIAFFVVDALDFAVAGFSDRVFSLLVSFFTTFFSDDFSDLVVLVEFLSDFSSDAASCCIAVVDQIRLA
jgi:hypothetical protein